MFFSVSSSWRVWPGVMGNSVQMCPWGPFLTFSLVIVTAGQFLRGHDLSQYPLIHMRRLESYIASQGNKVFVRWKRLKTRALHWSKHFIKFHIHAFGRYFALHHIQNMHFMHFLGFEPMTLLQASCSIWAIGKHFLGSQLVKMHTLCLQ